MASGKTIQTRLTAETAKTYNTYAALWKRQHREATGEELSDYIIAARLIEIGLRHVVVQGTWSDAWSQIGAPLVDDYPQAERERAEALIHECVLLNGGRTEKRKLQKYALDNGVTKYVFDQVLAEQTVCKYAPTREEWQDWSNRPSAVFQICSESALMVARNAIENHERSYNQAVAVYERDLADWEAGFDEWVTALIAGFYPDQVGNAEYKTAALARMRDKSPVEPPRSPALTNSTPPKPADAPWSNLSERVWLALVAQARKDAASKP